MAEIIASGSTSLSNLVRRVRTAVRDTNTTARKWSDDQIYLAIADAIGQSSNYFFTQGIYTGLDFVTGTTSYTLPDYVQRVTAIRRERSVPDIVVSAGTVLDWENLSQWHQVRAGVGSNTLYLDKPHPSGNVIVEYERDVPLPFIDSTLASALTDTTGTSVTIAVPATYSVYGIELPMFAQIAGAETVKITAITSAGAATIVRGQLGTTAAAAVAGDPISGILNVNDDRFNGYVVNSAAAYLNLLLLQDANRGSDVAGNLTAMREFEQRAEKALRRKAQRMTPRRVRPERSRRRIM